MKGAKFPNPKIVKGKKEQMKMMKTKLTPPMLGKLHFSVWHLQFLCNRRYCKGDENKVKQKERKNLPFSAPC